jgi:hypothetical protein
MGNYSKNCMNRVDRVKMRIAHARATVFLAVPGPGEHPGGKLRISLAGRLLRTLKKRSREFRLSDDAPQRAAAERIVERNGDRDCCCIETLLHDSMAFPR